jgi:hypothetical protein
MDSSASSFSQLSSLAELKGNKSPLQEDEDSGETTDLSDDDEDHKEDQVKPPSSSQDQNRLFAKLLSRSKSKDDLNAGYLLKDDQPIRVLSLRLLS